MISFPKYESYKDTGVSWLGEIPGHWKVQPGRAYLKLKKVKNTGNKVNTVLSLSYGRIIVKPEEKLHGLVPESFETYQIVEPGDIIVRATDLQNDKTSLRIGLVEDKGIITSAYLCLVPSEKMDSRFTYYLLHTYDLLKIYYGMGSGLRQNLDYIDFKYLPLPIPELEEQKKIVEFLDRKTSEIDQAIAQKQRLIELLQEQKAILINQAVTKGLNPDVPMRDSGIELIGKIPENWKVVRLKHLSLKITDGEHISPHTVETGIPLLSAKDVRERQIKFNDASYVSYSDAQKFWKRCNPERGDLLIVSRGATVGRIGLVEVDKPFCLMGSVILLKLKNIAYPDFMYFSLNQNAVQRSILQKSDASAQQAVYLIDVKETLICLPPKAEQEAIAIHLNKVVREYEAMIDVQNLAINRLQEFKGVLVSNAVTGKITI